MSADNLARVPVVNPFLAKEIVNKSNINGKHDTELLISTRSFGGVESSTIPVSLSGLQQLRYISVDAGTVVPDHSHNGPVVRLITSGDATVNGESYKAGDWMVIPPNTTYSISTDHGYTAAWVCVNCNS